MSDGKVIMGAFGKAPQQGVAGLGAEETAAPAEAAGTVQVPEETAQVAVAQPTLQERLAAIPPWVKFSALAVGLTGVGYLVYRAQNKPATAATPRKRRFKR